jgi:hypothetical protein
VGQKPEIGVYTQLRAGLQFDLDCHKPDTWSKFRVIHVELVMEFLTCLQVVPPGKLAPGRKDLFDAALGHKYWEWNEEQICPYL